MLYLFSYIQRATLGATIFRNFLSSSASEPVNVDSHSRSEADKALKKAADKNVFEQTQKQVILLASTNLIYRHFESSHCDSFSARFTC